MGNTRIQQILLALAGIVTVVLLFEFGDTKILVKENGETPMSSAHSNGSTNNAMTFEKLLSLASENLSKEQKDSVALLSQLADGASKKDKPGASRKLAQLWARTQNLIVSAHYLEDAARLDSNKNNWRDAADYYYIGMENTGDSSARVFAAIHSFECYANVFRFDSTDQNVRVLQAMCYINGLGNIMSGVTILKEVEQKDPDNELMNVTLGRLAIVSGQLDKAIPRLERTIKLYPSNVEAYFHLGEAYRAKGRKQDAIKMFEKCKALEKSPSFQQQLDTYINQIKNS